MKSRTLIISYDLVEVKDYKTLIAELKKLGARKKTLSTWTLVRQVPDDESAVESEQELRFHLRDFVDDDDRLFIGVLAASGGLNLLS